MKAWRYFAIVGVVLLALGVLGVGVVFAKTLPTWGGHMFGQDTGWFGGQMMNGWSGMMGGDSQDFMDGVDMDAMHDWMMLPEGMHQQVLDDLASALGLTPDELTSELSNQSLAQVAQNQGVSTQKLADILQTSVESAMNKAVTDGVLTQDQANEMLDDMSGTYEQMLSFMGFGFSSGYGGCHGGTPGGNSNNTSDRF